MLFRLFFVYRLLVCFFFEGGIEGKKEKEMGGVVFYNLSAVAVEISPRLKGLLEFSVLYLATAAWRNLGTVSVNL